MKKKIVTIIGARPQFIKAAPLSRILSKESKIDEILLHTGQHYDHNMSDVFWDELQIPQPKYNLNIHGGNHGEMTGRMLEAIERCLLMEKPEVVVVYGDTNSTLAGALAAAKLHIPVVHVESGLRSFNKSMPEEHNRILTDHVSSLLCCPTKTAVLNLANEDLKQNVFHTGDIMYDATLFAIEAIKTRVVSGRIVKRIADNYGFLTIHRAWSTDSIDNLSALLNYVEEFASLNGIKVIFPVHPRTRKLLKGMTLYNIEAIEPIGYFETQTLLSKSRYVLTDSGGLQKEAYFHRVPCITLRSETEWVETIHSGWNRLWKTEHYNDRTEINDYGDGNAAQVIAQKIMDNFI